MAVEMTNEVKRKILEAFGERGALRFHFEDGRVESVPARMAAHGRTLAIMMAEAFDRSGILDRVELLDEAGAVLFTQFARDDRAHAFLGGTTGIAFSPE